MSNPSDYTATVYSAPGCMKCRVTERKLKDLGIAVNTAQIHESPEALATMESEGWTALPLVELEGPEGVMRWCDMSTRDLEAVSYIVKGELR